MRISGILIIALIAFASCQGPETSIAPASEGNLLRLKTESEMDDALKIIPNSNDEELAKWEVSKGFTSYRTVMAKAYAELDELKDEKDFPAFKEKYNDIFNFDNEIIEPKIDIRLYQSLVNREGFYWSNGFLNRIVGDHIITGPESKYEIMRRADANTITTLSSDESLKIYRFTNSIDNTARVNAACAVEMSASYYDNPSGCRNDREAYIYAKSYIVKTSGTEGDWRQPRVQITVYGRTRNGWCNWYGYSTYLWRRNTTFTLNAWSVDQFGTSHVTSYYRTPPDAEGGDWSELTWDSAIGDRVLNQIITAYPFTSFHGEGKTRGTGEYWAILDCQ
jgi:hypothetical protein